MKPIKHSPQTSHPYWDLRKKISDFESYFSASICDNRLQIPSEGEGSRPTDFYLWWTADPKVTSPARRLFIGSETSPLVLMGSAPAAIIIRAYRLLPALAEAVGTREADLLREMSDLKNLDFGPYDIR